MYEAKQFTNLRVGMAGSPVSFHKYLRRFLNTGMGRQTDDMATERGKNNSYSSFSSKAHVSVDKKENNLLGSVSALA